MPNNPRPPSAATAPWSSWWMAEAACWAQHPMERYFCTSKMLVWGEKEMWWGKALPSRKMSRSESTSKKVPLVDRFQHAMRLYGRLVISVFLEMRPLTSMEMTRRVVKISVSRPCWYPARNCSPGKRSQLWSRYSCSMGNVDATDKTNPMNPCPLVCGPVPGTPSCCANAGPVGPTAAAAWATALASQQKAARIFWNSATLILREREMWRLGEAPLHTMTTSVSLSRKDPADCTDQHDMVS
mmetsp:Transcript_30552/g.66091  ORF Transcript_30552/g.66091 Transcript_30552/m.66091 type:complete len:241 (+) Transcript_30552:668-1390(+)